MKIYTNQEGTMLSLIGQSRVKAAFLYGSQTCAIQDFLSSLITALNCSTTCISYTDLIESGDFASVFCTLSLFNDRHIVQITNSAKNIDAKLKAFLMQDDISNIAFFISKVGETFSFKKDQQGFFYLPFYDTTIDTKTIKNTLAPKTIDASAIAYIKNFFPTDRVSFNQEIQKLKLLIPDKAHIDQNDLEALCEQKIALAQLDDICKSLITKDYATYVGLLDYCKQQDVPLILILRVVQKYFVNLYKVLTSNQNIADAVTKLNPPIFFKNVQSFISIASNTSIDKITRALEVLLVVERKIKRAPAAQYTYLYYLFCMLNF